MENKEAFVKRADAHIFLANEQLAEVETKGEVSASFLFGAARFNAWMAACEFDSAETMAEEKDKIIDYFVEEYKLMLEQHIKDHIESFDFSSN